MRNSLLITLAGNYADLNLRPVAATANRFIFPIIDSLMQSWGVHLTCLDCKMNLIHSPVNAKGF